VTLVDQSGNDMGVPELTREQRLDMLQRDLEQDVATLKDYVIQGRQKLDEMEQNVVKAENRLSDFLWLRHGDDKEVSE